MIILHNVYVVGHWNFDPQRLKLLGDVNFESHQGNFTACLMSSRSSVELKCDNGYVIKDDLVDDYGIYSGKSSQIQYHLYKIW